MRRNPLILGRIRWGALAVAFVTVACLFGVTTGAQAVVVNDNGTVAGVALVPNSRSGNSTTQSFLAASSIPIETSSGSCNDPAAATEPDILTAGSWPLLPPGQAQPICWHGGQVMHSNETFTLEWEGQAPYTYWSGTKGYVQTYLADVASVSGQLVNPYSDTTQYWDGSSATDRAANSSVFGGGCDDNGTAQCQFGSVTGSGPGNSLPANDCNGLSNSGVLGNNVYGGVDGAGAPKSIPNTKCIVDSDVQHEVTSLADQDGLIAHTQSGRTPLVTVLTPPGVVVCLDTGGKLCSANAGLTPPPPAPTTAGGTTNGSIPDGTYQVAVTYMTTSGENLPSAPTSVTTKGGNSTITVPSPPSEANVTGYYVYVATPGGAYVRQGTLQTIGQTDTLTSLSGSGQNPPDTPATFCSYHSQVVDPQSGHPISYVVQPWTAFTICDEPDVPPLPENPPPDVLEKNAGQRLVSPLSQGSMAAITNPNLNGWFGLDGLEINDQNSCQPLGKGLDTFTFGKSGQAPYYLQRESNNTSVVDSDPYTWFGCLYNDVLVPAFAAPSAINLGDTIDLDGSATASSLDIPNANYSWNFGDGTTGTGPSVEHTFGKAGNFTVTLTVTDRGGNTASLSQTVSVLGASGAGGQLGTPVNPPSTKPKPTTNVGSNGALQVRMQLLPQGLRQVLRSGIRVQVSANESANGLASVSIARAIARRAHIKAGRGATVVIGRGTVSQVKKGTVVLHLYLPRSTAKKLKHLKHLTLTVRLALVGPGGDHLAVDAAGRY